MTRDRFNELLKGPLHHPLPHMFAMRLTLALIHVVQSTGEAGDKALEEWCKVKEAEDGQTK